MRNNKIYKNSKSSEPNYWNKLVRYIIYLWLLCNLFVFYRWNFSVGNFEIELIEGENSEITLDCDSQTDNGNSINFVMQDGVVTSERIDHQWAFHFNSPIAGAWKLDDNKLKVLNTFSDELFDTSSDSNINMESLMYLGIYVVFLYGIYCALHPIL